LTNPRYTGYQVWNRQRTDEVLDVDNVALGHAAKMRWNPADQWLFSEQIAHPPIIIREELEQAQAILAGRGSRTPHKPHRRPRVYALRGVLICGLCDRRMTDNWNNDQASFSRWLVRLVRTRQLRSLPSAARTSAVTCRVRCWSAARSR
jgi:site-specific DNA recombinase